MKVAVFGFTDKRVIIMSILTILQAQGEVLLVSADRHFQRLTENAEEIGTFENTLVAVTTLPPEEILPDLDHVESDFDHILYDCTNELPENIDKIIYVMSDFVAEHEKEILLNLEHAHPIYQLYDAKSKRSVGKLKFFVSKTKKVTGRTRRAVNKDGEVDEVDAPDTLETDIVEVPEHLQMSAENSFCVTLDMIRQLEIAECYRHAPKFVGRDLATVLVGIFGEDFYLNVPGMVALLSGGGKVSAK